MNLMTATATSATAVPPALANGLAVFTLLFFLALMATPFLFKAFWSNHVAGRDGNETAWPDRAEPRGFIGTAKDFIAWAQDAAQERSGQPEDMDARTRQAIQASYLSSDGNLTPAMFAALWNEPHGTDTPEVGGRNTPKPAPSLAAMENDLFFLTHSIELHLGFEPIITGHMLNITRRQYRRLAEFCDFYFETPQTPADAFARYGITVKVS